MIYSTDIIIPTLSPIQFREPKSVDFYPHQQYYVGKLPFYTRFCILIAEGLFESETPITLSTFNLKGISVHSVELIKTELSAGNYYAAGHVNFNVLPKGLYTIKLLHGDIVLAESLLCEKYDTLPKHICDIRYSNSENDWNMIFSSDRFHILVEAGFHPNDFKAEGEKSDYPDQEITNHVIYSQPYSTEMLSIGGNQGIPNWLCEKLNAILMCDSLEKDGETYSVAQGAKLEKIDQTYDGLARYRVELQKENNYVQ